MVGLSGLKWMFIPFTLPISERQGAVARADVKVFYIKASKPVSVASADLQKPSGTAASPVALTRVQARVDMQAYEKYVEKLMS